MPRQKRDWRSAILSRLPETAASATYTTHAALEEALAEAARRRRMRPEDYVMRAVRAFVCADLDVDPEMLEEVEPPIANVLVPRNPRRWRGRGFGPWRIRRLEEVP